MSKKARGLRIGRYRITPLGLVTLGIIFLIILIAVVMIVFNPLGGVDSPFVKETPEPTIDPASVTPTPSPTPTPTPTPTPEPKSARIRSLGEIAMQDNLLKAATTDGKNFDFSEMFTYVSEIMGNADYTVADVEGVMGGTEKLSGSGEKLITPPELITNLKDCGVDMLMLANDHALDGGFDALKAQLKNCADAGMDYVGAAASSEEKKTPVVKDINGIKVAFLAYTDGLNVKEKKVEKEALKYGVNLVTKSNVYNDVKAAKQAGAEVVICYMSWGKMLKRDVTDDQKKIAEVLVKAGVDVIIGYGPHTAQKCLWQESKPDDDGRIHRTLMMCSTGNFLSDQRDQYFDSGAIFEFTIQETGSGTGEYAIVNPIYIPTYVWRSEGETDNYIYHTMAAGQWLSEQPEGMSYNDVTRMREVWAEIQSAVGSEAATVAAE